MPRRDVEISVVAWIDLLGYGAQLKAARFNPASAEARVAIRRLREFHGVLRAHSSARSPVFPMNDGAVVFRDLKWESRESGGGFLRKVVRLHRVVNRHDQMLGFPGARTVIAVGHRQRGLERGIVMDQAQLDRLTVRADSGELDVRTALAHAFHARPVYGYVPELQANFAFTKAFVAEHAGSRIGLSGPRCFVDTALLNGDAEWIELGDRCWLRWSTIAAEFAEVTSLDPRAANLARWIGLRTGSEVDAALSRLRPPSRIAYLASTVRHTARSRLRRIGRY